MRFRLLHRASWVLLAGAVACASELPEEPAPLAQAVAAAPKLQPVLVFASTGATMGLDGRVEGAFPARFRLSALPPPPPGELHDLGVSEAGEPVPATLIAAVAAIEAGRIEHVLPSRLRWAWTCGATRDEGCTGKSRVCGRTPRECANVAIHCDIEDANCTLTELSGNLTPLRSAVRQLEGRVTDLYLLYVSADAPAGSFLSRLYADGAALAAGWHLARPRPVAPYDPAASARCDVEATRGMIAEYARKLGRAFADESEIFEYLLVTRYNEKRGTAHRRSVEIEQDEAFHEIWNAIDLDLQVAFMSAQITQKCDGPAGHLVVGGADSRELTMTMAEPLPQVGAFFPAGPPFAGAQSPLDWPWN